PIAAIVLSVNGGELYVSQDANAGWELRYRLRDQAKSAVLPVRPRLRFSLRLEGEREEVGHLRPSHLQTARPAGRPRQASLPGAPAGLCGLAETASRRDSAARLPADVASGAGGRRNTMMTEHRIDANIEIGTQLYTDEHLIFTGLDGLFYKHDAVNHSAGEYAAGAAHTNSIESVWAVLKRGYYGVYHSMSGKHLRRYLDEFTFRLNEGNVKRHSLERLDSMIEAVSGKRLTYAGLTA